MELLGFNMSPIQLSLLSVLILTGLSSLVLYLSKPKFIMIVSRDGRRKIWRKQLFFSSLVIGLVAGIVVYFLTQKDLNKKVVVEERKKQPPLGY